MAPLFSLLLLRDDPVPRSGPLNMALDEGLLAEAARGGIPILRIYRWEGSWISFGYFQRWKEVQASLPPDVRAVRRWTGGGTVDHSADQTYSLMVPRSHPFARLGAAESYRQLHERLARAMEAGEEIRVASAAASPAPASGWCFTDHPVPGDLMAGTRKLAGAAQRRTDLGLLHQGSIRPPGPSPAVPWSRFAGLLAREVVLLPPDPGEEAEAATVSRTRYATATWQERR